MDRTGGVVSKSRMHMRGAGIGLLLVLLHSAVAQETTRSKMKIEILPDPAGVDSTQSVLERLRAGIGSSENGTRAADTYEMLSMLDPDVVNTRMTAGDVAAVNILSDSGIRAGAGADCHRRVLQPQALMEDESRPKEPKHVL